MSRRIDEISTDFDSLTPSDFDVGAVGIERLDKLCDEVSETQLPADCASILFRTMERLDGADLGSPGPLVHTLEGWRGAYEEILAESVRRKPTPLSVWMVNRILNSKPPDRDAWIALLRGIAEHPLASEESKAQAEQFLRHQAKH
jgi:hypothetical protein